MLKIAHNQRTQQDILRVVNLLFVTSCDTGPSDPLRESGSSLAVPARQASPRHHNPLQGRSAKRRHAVCGVRDVRDQRSKQADFPLPRLGGSNMIPVVRLAAGIGIGVSGGILGLKFS
ncbi:uncharacterized protein LDX57_011793 [Aspergillus melleus]|uniref:uncharacterized protein n=1 Tax=Aspergillus melleus TaxID=138277 RepID=UPI001E8E92C5|nr:uncharacterized protein LDX57_011793 [Aspergillus melleus]KAH8434155.1 hypothetical protein LDX57_011793 [Aspergillus melleus]